MRIDAFIIGWNIEQTIQFTIRHYSKFCDRIVYFDNHSDDASRLIAMNFGADVRLFGTVGELNDQAYLDVKNSCWKSSRADWVIVVDDDEILYEPPKPTERGTIMRTQGFEIFSHQMPVDSYMELTEGVLNDNYSKQVCFRPSQILDINYVYGCHVSRPSGNVIWSEDTLFLLHYRSIGGPERLIERHRSYLPRLSEFNKQWRLGHHYSIEEDKKRKEWLDSYTKRIPFSSVLQR